MACFKKHAIYYHGYGSVICIHSKAGRRNASHCKLLSYFVHFELTRPQIAQDADAEKSNAALQATQDFSSNDANSPVASI